MTPLHRQRHPEDVPGCFGCRVCHVHIAHSSEWSGEKRKEAALSKDLDAYARLRAEGLKPEAVAGAARVEQTAEHKLDITHGTSPFIRAMNTRQKTEATQTGLLAA